MAPREAVPRPAAFAAPLLGDEPSPLAAGLRSAAALTRRHRRLLAATCAGAAVVVAMSALTPSSPGSLPPDARGGAGSALLPTGAGDRPAGDADRVAVTVRLADPAGLLLVRAGSHAEVMAGPAADAGASPASASAGGEVLAEDAVVVAVPQPPATGSSAGSGAPAPGLLAGSATSGASTGLDGVVVLAVPPSDARRIAAAAGTRPLSVAVALAMGWPR
jgi:hypothetical protein